ncbi:MAG: pyruvate dehydrogenase complex dihydrolipoamide acetyltransferase [Myxococcaceae bacterium]|nr:pyruvate dehydrogenase complex dihydrolipoamide acetyltransferase [Myxococcaceae bacterium]MCI0672519.1 pyruvate dehydrogenase complex dihydrolipoamide acetyltransferase [Myxococcaceae bacterium]
MATPVQMPALSPTMKEGKITKWLKKEGDKISSGEAIAEVETDKSNLEVEAYDDGYLLKIAVGEDQMAPVGAPIAFIGEKGEKVEAGAAAPAPKATSAEAPKATPAPAPMAPAAAPAPAPRAVAPVAAVPTPPRREEVEGRLRASPLAKKMAREQGLELAELQGTGPQGRIVKRDVEAAMAQPRAEAPAAPALRAVPAPAKKPAFIPVPFRAERQEPVAKPISSMRRVIAQRMAEVKPGVPHFYLAIEVEMDAAMKVREEAKALEAKVSVNDLVIKAAAVALRRSPKMNVSLQGDQVLQFSNVDVGIAVAIEDGLITPILKDADQKGLATISGEARDLAERARNRKLRPEEYTGGTLTVSNLGMYGIDQFIAVINPPHAGILAVGAVTDKVVVRDGQMVVRKMMSVTLSGDHRVIDGAVGAEYLRELKALLEHPMRLLF